MLYLLTTLAVSIEHSLYKSIFIFLISFFSNTFSAISGGGAGLLQLPALILSGIPYYQALASHKFATVALGIGSSLGNYKSIKNDIFLAWQILIFGLPGVIFGASIVAFISAFGVILAASYMLILYKKVFLGITNETLKAKVNDLSIFELIVYVKLTFLILLIGIKPDIILDYTTSSLDRITKLYPISIF